MLLPLLQNNLLTGTGGGVVATLAATEAADTSSASSQIAVAASGSPAELGDTLAASGSIGSTSVTGTLSVIEAGDILVASASISGGVAVQTGAANGRHPLGRPFTWVPFNPVDIKRSRKKRERDILFLHH
jgi:hypothetical protein